MKESIFFNGEQLKIIRWYGILYQICFKYWIYILALILSFVLVGYAFTSWYFTSIYLLEPWDTAEQSFSMWAYQKNSDQVASIPWLSWYIINGKQTIEDWNIKAQDSLLSYNWIILPRLIDISTSNLDYFVENFNNETYDGDLLHSFFVRVIQKPLSTKNFWAQMPGLLKLNWNLEKVFWLGCLNGNTQYSFVCTTYIDTFLSRFYQYNLNSEVIYPDGSKSDELTDELKKFYSVLRNKWDSKDKICNWLIKYWEYGWVLDNRYSDILRECDSTIFSRFTLMRDFQAITKAFSVGYVDSTVYNNALLNEYKLFSFQQLLYKQMSAWADVNSLMKSYISYLSEILTKEVDMDWELLTPFAKSFAYWYNTNIIKPFLENEDSNMDRDDRNKMSLDLQTLHSWDRFSNFKWLASQSRYTAGTSWWTSFVEQEEEKNLQQMFRISYMPAKFKLMDISWGDWDLKNTLYITWLDQELGLTIEATLVYQNIQLYVTEFRVVWNDQLTEYLGKIITKEKYSLNKVISLMQENYDYVNEATSIEISICDELEQSSNKWNVVSCSEDQIVISVENRKEKDTENIVYTFTLESWVLKNVEISDKVLETRLLGELDLSRVDRSSSFSMIKAILAFSPEEESAVSMKDYVLINDSFTKYLWFEPTNMWLEKWELKVSFAAWGIKFIGTYDVVNNTIKPISIDFWEKRRPVIVQWFALILAEDQQETLNTFLLNPLEYLRKLNPALVKRYFDDEKNK